MVFERWGFIDIFSVKLKNLDFAYYEALDKQPFNFSTYAEMTI